ncbi:MAG: phosphatase PAP2 family protein [Chitinophagaceae bacterium]|nr:phosphatase PAP2 family protein [Chitinophagaceae bacterium]
MSEKRITQPHFPFLSYTLVLTVILFLLVCIFNKTALFLGANIYHNHLLDRTFSIFTNLGDGLCALVIVLFYVSIKNRPMSIKLFLTFILSGLVVQLFKLIFHAPRPKTFFPHQFYHHFINGFTHSGYNSFPSGHAATAFGVAAILSFGCRKPIVGFLTFIIAVIVGYSRIYLGDHFVEDVLAGMIIGIFVAFFVEKGYTLYAGKFQHKQTRHSSTV